LKTSIRHSAISFRQKERSALCGELAGDSRKKVTRERERLSYHKTVVGTFLVCFQQKCPLPGWVGSSKMGQLLIQKDIG
jgi:hypothetical protein